MQRFVSQGLPARSSVRQVEWLRLRTSTTSWSVDSGRVMARHWQDACVDAVAKLPPLRAPRFSETIRVELGAFLSIRAATTHPDSSTRWRTGAVAVSSLCPRPWDLVGVSLVAA